MRCPDRWAFGVPDKITFSEFDIGFFSNIPKLRTFVEEKPVLLLPDRLNFFWSNTSGGGLKRK